MVASSMTSRFRRQRMFPSWRWPEGIAGGNPRLLRRGDIARRARVGETGERRKSHGRIETRRYWQSANIDWFADRAQLENLRGVGFVEAVREIPAARRAPNGATTSAASQRTSPASPALCAATGASRFHLRRRPQPRPHPPRAANLATLRRIALNLLSDENPPQKSSTENASPPPLIQINSLPSSQFDASAL